MIDELEIKQSILNKVFERKDIGVSELPPILDLSIDICYSYSEEIYYDGYISFIDATSFDGKDALLRITGKGEVFYKNGGYKKVNKSNMKIFISHSHNDVKIAKALIELLRAALYLKSNEIRCTSVDGYRLSVGSSTDDQLKLEIHDSDILIGLISESSISSYYVLFELGARWGANKPLIPLIVNQSGVELLKGPLQGINALCSYEEAQLFQLVGDIAKLLNVELEQSNSFHAYIKKLAELTSVTGEVEQNNSKIVKIGQIEMKSDYSDADEKIKEYCKNYWPDDFRMQVRCIDEQKEAVAILKQGKPDDISEKDFNIIRQKAAKDWPKEYNMRVNQEQEEFEAIRKLRDM